MFQILSGPWSSIKLSRCRCREAEQLSRAQLCLLVQRVENSSHRGEGTQEARRGTRQTVGCLYKIEKAYLWVKRESKKINFLSDKKNREA